MIDPITAFAAVQSAVALIKKAKATVDDVRSLGPLLGSYFEAKQKTVKAVKEAKKAGGSNLAQAVQIEMELLQQEQFEAELKEIFIYSGHADIWSKIQQRVHEAHRAEIEEERAEKDRARRRKRQAEEAAAVFGALLISAMLVAGIAFAVISTMRE